MKHKTIAQIAIAMVVVFLATVLLYPTMFNPDNKGAPPPVEAPPIPPAAN